MSPRVRLLIVIALVVVLIGVGAALLLPQLTGGPRPTATPGGVVVTSEGGGGQVVVPPTYTPEPTVKLVVAIQQINRGTIITPELVAEYDWPERYAPQNGISSVDAVIGMIARVDIFREQPILQTIVTENLSQLGAEGSDAGALLPQGSRMIAFPIDRFTSVAYALQPGDRVDMVISLLFVDIDEDFQTLLPNEVRFVTRDEEGNITVAAPVEGRPETVPFPVLNIGSLPAMIGPSEVRRPRLSTQMIVQDALVVYVGDFPPDGRIVRIGATPLPAPETVPTVDPAARRGEPTALPTVVVRPDLISLAVQPQEAVVLSYLLEARVPVTFLLRPATDTGIAPVVPVTLDYIMQTYGIQVPAKRGYGIEPAIRSIRRVIVGDTIALNEGPSAPAPTAAP